MELPKAPQRLYHGTTAAALDSVLRDGLRPRGRNVRRNNWAHTVPSNPGTIYLTDTYALYYACNAMDKTAGSEGLIIEIDVGKLDKRLIVADEDAIEQASRGRDSLPADWDMKRRTIYYRSRVRQYSWLSSLAVLGTCGYQGRIPPEAFTRAVVIPDKLGEQPLSLICDTTISLMGFKHASKRQKAFLRWAFADQLEPELLPTEIPLDGGMVYRDFTLPDIQRSLYVRDVVV